jgi:penicillin-binding protein activator
MRSLLVALFFLTAAGCSGPQVRYADPDEVEAVNENFGRTDLKLIANRMVKSMIRVYGPSLQGRPYIALREVRNDTGEYIDTKAITDKIRTAVLNSGRFRFTTEKENLADTLDEVEMQEESGLYRKQGGARKGNWQPPQLLLRGRMTAIKKRNADVKDVYYLITMTLDEIDSATIVWTDEKEINKRVAR